MAQIMSHLQLLVRAFAVALLATAISQAVSRFVLAPLLGFSPNISVAVIAVISAAWFGDLKAGLIATILNGVLLWSSFSEDAELALTPHRQIRLLLFYLIGGAISWGSDALHTARRRAELRQRELEEEVRRRKVAETALREREERIRLAVEAADIGTFDFNPVTGQQQWSSRAKFMLGFAPDDDLGTRALQDRVHPEDQQRVNQAIQSAFAPQGDGAFGVECRLIWPDGSVHWLIAKGQATFTGESSERHVSRFIGTVIDITERKLAEQTLLQAEERFRTLATCAPVGIFQTDAAGAGLFANEAWCAITGATHTQALGHGWKQFVHPEDKQRVFENWQNPSRNRRNEVTEFRFINRTAGVRWVVASTTAIVDSAGKVTGYVGTIVDLTDRKAVEDVVREDEARLRSILDNTPAAISLKDLQGRYLAVNRNWEELFGIKNHQIVGLSNEELLSLTSSAHMSRDIADHFIAIDRSVIETGEPVEFEDPVQYGDVPQFYYTVKFPIRDAKGSITGIGGISLDITERRQAVDALAAEQELLHHTIEVQDHERQVIAYEIHDGLIQYVTGALMQLEGIRSLDNSASSVPLEMAVQILRRAVAEGRRLIDGIRTPVLDGLGIVAALENLISEEERAHIDIEFINCGDLGRMDGKVEEAAYRITQEALTNCFKHSKSNKVRIELSRRKDRVHLEVRDWGVGFAPKAAKKGIHGLRGMTERAKIAGGRCSIEPADDGGTRVVADLPYVPRG